MKLNYNIGDILRVLDENNKEALNIIYDADVEHKHDNTIRIVYKCHLTYPSAPLTGKEFNELQKYINKIMNVFKKNQKFNEKFCKIQK